MTPKVSIIVPCYNCAAYLAETLESVLGQSYSNWECIIINDGSSDNTESVGLGFVARDERFKLINTPDLRLSGARNAGIRVATGQYLLPLDGDDKIAPEYIEACVRELEKDPDLKIVYCEAEMFDGKQGRWELPAFSFQRFAISNIIFCSGMFRRQSWEEVGGYDESLKLGFEDWEFWIAILSKGGKVLKLPLIGFYYRVRAQSLTSKMLANSDYDQVKRYVIQKHYQFFARYLGDIDQLYREKEEYRIFTENIQNSSVYKIYSKAKSLITNSKVSR